jgi:hypothetical protein
MNENVADQHLPFLLRGSDEWDSQLLPDDAMRTIRADKPLAMDYFFSRIRRFDIRNDVVVMLFKFDELFSLLDKAIEFLEMRAEKCLMSVLREAHCTALQCRFSKVSRLREKTNIRTSGSSWPAFYDLHSTLHFSTTAYLVNMNHEVVIGYWNTIQRAEKPMNLYGTRLKD